MPVRSKRFVREVTALTVLLTVGLSACGKLPISGSSSGSSSGTSSGGTSTCTGSTPPSGTAWTPNVSGVTLANLDSNAAVSTTTLTSARTFVGYMNSVQSTVTFTFQVTEDPGTQGSLSLVAQPVNVDSAITNAGANVYPVLVELTDPGGKEFVQLSGCSNGFFSCSGSSCSSVSSCAPGTGSAFVGVDATARRTAFDERNNLRTANQVSVNLFPTCNWTAAPVSGSDIPCPFKSSDNTSFFSSGKLRTGTWTAKYALVSQFIQGSATTGGPISGSMKAALQLNVIRKKDPGTSVAGTKGAVHLNLVIVGSKNIEDSRTAKGKQNLDLLMANVIGHFAQSSTQIKVASIAAYEWDCANGGDTYANATTDDLGALLATGSALIAGDASRDPAINLFLVSSFSDNNAILGIAGGIPGAPIAGTTTSGAVFATFDDLANYNPGCTPGVTCATSAQDASFLDMGVTVAHEAGHFLGLNHPSESTGSQHDRILDTPICTKTSSGVIGFTSCRANDDVASGYTAPRHPTTGLSCYSQCSSYNSAAHVYCAAAAECQFNHLMWWTSKHFFNGSGDGNLLSTNSGDLLNYSPYVR